MQYQNKLHPNINFFAAVYGCNTYGAGTYNNQTCTSADGGAKPAENGPLANTGFDVIMLIAFAIALLGAGAALLVKKFLRSRRTDSQK